MLFLNIKVSLMVDHKLLMIGLTQLLEKEPNIKVINTISNPKSLYPEIINNNPDVIVIILSFRMGIDLAREIIEFHPNSKIIIVSKCDCNEYIKYAYEIGISSFITSDKSIHDLITAIERIHLGDKLYSGLNTNRSVEALTQKELEVLQLMLQDKRNSDISKELIISKRTVEYHISSILNKLDAKSRVGAVVKGIKKGLISIL